MLGDLAERTAKVDAMATTESPRNNPILQAMCLEHQPSYYRRQRAS
jgi:hypothetical protein